VSPEYIQALRNELADYKQRAAADPSNETWSAGIKACEEQLVLGGAGKESRVKPVAETAEADLSEVETAVVTTKRKR
jgi:hypothetical protein